MSEKVEKAQGDSPGSSGEPEKKKREYKDFGHDDDDKPKRKSSRASPFQPAYSET